MTGSDFTALQAKIDALTAQVTQTTTVEGSAVALLNGFAAQIQEKVQAALDADDAADQGSIQAAAAAIDGVTQQFVASATALGTAVVANTPPVPPQPNPQAKR
jgi:hypothetical protein